MRKLELTDFDNGIEPEHEQELCNILGTHDPRGFLNNILYNKSSYSINASKAVKAHQFLSQFYELPVYFSPSQSIEPVKDGFEKWLGKQFHLGKELNASLSEVNIIEKILKHYRQFSPEPVKEVVSDEESITMFKANKDKRWKK